MYLGILLLTLVIIYISYYSAIVRKEAFQDTDTNAFKKCSFKHGVLAHDELKDLGDLLSNLMDFFSSNDIEYFGHSGTAIGAFRSGGMLPFDDDIDVGVIQSEITAKKIDDYENSDYYFKKAWFGYKYKKRNSKIFIDIMVFKLDDDDKYKMINGAFPEVYLYKDELFPLQEHMFNDIKMPFPNNSIAYLDRTFPDWDTTIKINCGHGGEMGRTSKCINQVMNIKKEFAVTDYHSKYLCYTPFS